MQYLNFPYCNIKVDIYVTVVVCVCVSVSRGELSMLGPAITEEPPPRVFYAMHAGVRVRCAARGQPPPVVSWLADDGTTLNDQPGLR